MSNKAITKNDLAAVLNEVLPPTPSEYKKLLWTNPSPTSSFAAQTVSLDLSDYDEVEIEAKQLASGSIVQLCRVEIGKQTKCLFKDGNANNFYTRTFVTSASSVQFGDAYYNATLTNTDCVPTAIYGIKYERVAQPQLEPNALIFRDYTLTSRNATYYEDDIDIGVTGYTPISVFWNTNQVGLFIYNMRLKNKSTLNVGRSMDNGGSLSSNYLYIKVVYLLDALVGL